MKRVYTIVATLLLGLFSMGESNAQSLNIGGTTLNNDIIGWGDLYNLSFTSHNYGTARSMAMGNAFTALGADMVSTMLNPAGIGMYPTILNDGKYIDSDVSITPIMQFTKSPTRNSNSYYGADVPKSRQAFNDHTERFGFASAGAVIPVYKSTGVVTNINIGLTYNRVADFNQNMLNASLDNSAYESMANVFCTMSNVDNLQTNSDGTMPFGNDPYYWGAVLAYKNGLTNKDDQGWFIDRISKDARIDQYSSVQTRGSVGEYALSVGFNLIDCVYIGATLGLQSVDYSREVYYGENYNYNPGQQPSGEDMPYQLNYMNYLQRTDISGTGVNFKLGVTARPLDWLRIGVAYHTPTFYTVDFRYDAEMWSQTFSAGDNPEDYDVGPMGYMYDEAYSGVWEDAGPYAWQYHTPSRLLTGIAATIGKHAIVSVDYERSWYQSIDLDSAPIKGLDYTPAIKECFKGSNTVRVGAEAYILPFLPVRVGYIWSGSTLREGYENMIATHQLPTSESFITAGFGIKFTRFIYIDLAYQYGRRHMTSYQTFYAIDYDNPEYDIESRVFSTTTDRHIAIITLGLNF